MNYHPYASAPSPPPEKSSDIGDDYLYSDQIASQSQPPSLGEGEEEIIFASNNTAVTDNVEDTSKSAPLVPFFGAAVARVMDESVSGQFYCCST